jgi:hypothetical protein
VAQPVRSSTATADTASGNLKERGPGIIACPRDARRLIVEDEAKTGDYLRQGLREAGFTVDLARDGLDGLHLALERRPRPGRARRDAAPARRLAGILQTLRRSGRRCRCCS